MAGNDTAITYKNFLSPHEIESVAHLEDAYSLQAKRAAFEFAQKDGMPDEELVAFMGRTATKLEAMGWEQRSEVAKLYRELTAALGATATQSANAPGLTIVTDAPVPAGALDLVVHYDDEVDDNAAVFAANGAREEVEAVATDGEARKEDIEPAPSDPLNKAQRRWLSEILDEDDIAQIEALPVYQRLDFAAKLGEKYRKLSITRIGPEGKRQRAEQFIAFMGGKNFKEIAELDKAWEHKKIGVHVPQMARSIRDRREHLSLEDILSCIPKCKPTKKPEEPLAAEGVGSAEEVAPELTTNQKKWYAKVYDAFDKVEPELSALTIVQRDRLAELLGLRLNSAIVRRHGVAKTHRRIEQMTMLIRGDTYEEIATAVSLPIAQVKSDLHDTTVKLKSNISQDDLRVKIQKAKVKQEIAATNGSQ